MTTPQLIIAIATPILLACIIQLMRERRMYRREWLAMAERYFSASSDLKREKCEKSVARLNEKYCHEACERMNIQCAAKARLIDELSVTVDALMNGDRRCVNGHRYYASVWTGNGLRCPYCVGEEINSINRCDCGAIATIEDYERMVCKNCYIPF